MLKSQLEVLGASKKYIYVILTFAYGVFIFHLSSLSSPPNPITAGQMMELYRALADVGVEFLAYPFYLAYRYPDKFAHVLLYMGFGFVLNPAVRSVLGKHPELVSVALGAVYGASDELHQSFVPYRSASMGDFLADFTGLLISQVLILAGTRVMRARVRGPEND